MRSEILCFPWILQDLFFPDENWYSHGKLTRQLLTSHTHNWSTSHLPKYPPPQIWAALTSSQSSLSSCLQVLASISTINLQPVAISFAFWTHCKKIDTNKAELIDNLAEGVDWGNAWKCAFLHSEFSHSLPTQPTEIILALNESWYCKLHEDVLISM